MHSAYIVIYTFTVLCTQVHIYNVPKLPDIASTLGDLARAQAAFPIGQRLAVINPLYKLMMDGTYGIRVDNPAEV